MSTLPTRRAVQLARLPSSSPSPSLNLSLSTSFSLLSTPQQPLSSSWGGRCQLYPSIVGSYRCMSTTLQALVFSQSVLFNNEKFVEFAQHKVDKIEPNPFVLDAFQTLTAAEEREEGSDPDEEVLERKIIVISNSDKAELERALSSTGLKPFVTFVAGGACIPVKSPDPGFLIWAIESNRGLSAEKSFLISNNLEDVRMAKQSSVPVIAITEGDETRSRELSALHPDAVIEDCREVEEAMQRLRDSSTY